MLRHCKSFKEYLAETVPTSNTTNMAGKDNTSILGADKPDDYKRRNRKQQIARTKESQNAVQGIVGEG